MVLMSYKLQTKTPSLQTRVSTSSLFDLSEKTLRSLLLTRIISTTRSPSFATRVSWLFVCDEFLMGFI